MMRLLGFGKKTNRRFHKKPHVLWRLTGFFLQGFKRHAFKWFATAGVLALLVGIFLSWRYVVAMPLFAVHHIEVHHTQRTQESMILAYADVPIGTPILSLAVDDIAMRVSRHPWIRTTTVRRQLPDKLLIDVVEHKPALCVSMGELYLADEQGQLFKSFSPYDELVLPVLTGLKRQPLAQSLQPVIELVHMGVALNASIHDYPLPLGDIHELHWDDDLGWSVVLYSNKTANSVRAYLGKQPLQRLGHVAKTLQVLADKHQVASVIWANGVKNPERVQVKLLNRHSQMHTQASAVAHDWDSAPRGLHGTEG